MKVFCFRDILERAAALVLVASAAAALASGCASSEKKSDNSPKNNSEFPPPPEVEGSASSGSSASASGLGGSNSTSEPAYIPPGSSAGGTGGSQTPDLGVSGIGSQSEAYGASATTSNGRVYANPPPELSETEREAIGRVLASFTAGDEEYNGFYNQFAFRATILNTPVANTLLNEQARYYQWENAKILEEREKVRQDARSNTDIFVSFYTPERKNDNLADTKTIWRVFLDVNGQRYIGKAKKSKKLLSELQTLYPYHTRWNTPYVVSFPVPVESIDRQQPTLTITGPLGARTVVFTGKAPPQN